MGYSQWMLGGFVPWVFGAVLASLLLGWMRPGRMRAMLIIILYAAPFALFLWLLAQPDFDKQQGVATRGELAFLTIVFGLPFWAAFTIFPFKLTSKLMAIHRGQ